MILNVYIKNNIDPFSFNSEDRNPTVDRLTTYFNSIVAGTSWSCTVNFVAALPAAVAETDLVCYLAMGRSASTLKNFAHADPPQTPGWTHTDGSGTAASEVFYGAIPSFERQTLLPNLIFHELMHNKAGMDNAMHHHASGLAAAQIFSVTPLTPQNIEFMRSRLDTPRRQWTLG
ncbi:MAG: hypothetical protein JWO03_3672 [Bacteroidetes bacterium]|nr:hypothetical protein [Bacteroidota bacterium]